MIESATNRLQRDAIERQRFEAYEAWEQEHSPIKQAREILDPQGFMRRRAEQLVTEACLKQDKQDGPDPMTDLLGGARVVLACQESGRNTEEALLNHYNDIRTAFTEALLNGGHISAVQTELNTNGEAAIGDLAHWQLGSYI